MSKICAKCSKAVYSLEELKCLDKIWHKGCFKCWECGMTLSMKNYKGYDKKPYCVAHYPQTKATVVAETPEIARATQNTKIQSQIKYHEDFEKMKGSKIEVTDDPELRRVKRIGSLVSQVEYKGQREKNVSGDTRRPSLPHTSDVAAASNKEDYKPSPYSDRSASHSTVYSSTGSKAVNPPVARRIGSIADYDPMNENYGSLAKGYHPTSRSNSMTQEWEETLPISPTLAVSRGLIEEATVQESQEDTVTEERPSQPAVSTHQDAIHEPVADESTDSAAETNDQVEDTQVESQVEPHVEPQVESQAEPEVSSERTDQVAITYRALYAYEAQDEDEASFEEGDIIIDTEIIDEGWMMATVKRTGDRGMMPSNYFEPVADNE